MDYYTGYLIAIIIGLICYVIRYEYVRIKIDKSIEKYQEEVRKEKEEEKKHWIRGEFYEEKLYEDQAVIKQLKEKIGDGYFDGCLINIILNIEKTGLEKLLVRLEEAVPYYYNGGGDIDKYDEENTVEEKAKFFEECVILCKQQIKELECK